MKRWILTLLWLCAALAVQGGVRAQEADSTPASLSGTYRTCSEAWGHWETLVLDGTGFRHSFTTDLLKRGVHVGHYERERDRLILHADSGPPGPTAQVFDSRQPDEEDTWVVTEDDRDGRLQMSFESLTYVIDHVQSVAVLWRSDAARVAFRTTGRLDKFKLLVRVGDPAYDGSAVHCATRFGGVFADPR